MLRSDRFYSSTSSLLAGILLILISLCMLLGRDKLYFNFINLFIVMLLILGTLQFVRYFINKQKKSDKQITFTRSFLYLLFCLILSCFPTIPMSILPLLFSIYLMLNGVIKLITFLILYYEKAPGKIKELFLVVLYFSIGIPLLISPIKNVSVMLFIMGIYTLLLGISFIIDFITSLIPIRIKNRLRRRIKITLPVIVEAILPYQVLNEINYFITKEEDIKSINYNDKNEDVIPDMEIFVHSSMNGFNRLGHVDIYFDNKVYSYGNYDDSSKKFFELIGDGVVFITDKEHYIPFCISHSHKTIIGFGLKLNERQKQSIIKYINNLFNNMYCWYSPIEVAKLEKKKIKKTDFGDYASSLYKATKAEFYKFKKGRFKKYFTLGVNCCLLADSIIGKSGTNILKMNGIITPGTYYEYLNREFNKKNSMVISKTIYNSESTGIKKNRKKKNFKGFSN